MFLLQHRLQVYYHILQAERLLVTMLMPSLRRLWWRINDEL